MPLPTPYAHQTRSVHAVRAAWSQGARRICLVLPCGAGKTITASMIVEGAIAKGRRVLWLAHREELLSQAAVPLAEVGVPFGLIKAGRPTQPRAPIQIASVQTLHSRPELLPPDISIVISDECHHDKATTRQALFGRYDRDRLELVLGLTATPERGDRQPLGEKSGGIYQHMIVGATVAELQKTMRPDGHPILVPMRVVGPSRPTKNLFRAPIDGLVEFGRRADGSLRPAILFLSSLEESREANDDACRRGIRSAHVDGSTNDVERERTFDRLKRGELDLVCNVMIATEGFDAPRVEVIGVARGCSAASTWIQMIMRAARSSPSTGKRDGLLIDYRGFSHVHGLIQEPREYSLEGRAISRGEKVELRQCPKCASVFAPAPTCPDCGHVMAVVRSRARVTKTDAVEITPDMITSPSAKRETFDRLCREAAEKGWKPAAVGMRFKARYGHWPWWPIPGFTRKGAAA